MKKKLTRVILLTLILLSACKKTEKDGIAPLNLINTEEDLNRTKLGELLNKALEDKGREKTYKNRSAQTI